MPERSLQKTNKYIFSYKPAEATNLFKQRQADETTSTFYFFKQAKTNV